MFVTVRIFSEIGALLRRNLRSRSITRGGLRFFYLLLVLWRRWQTELEIMGTIFHLDDYRHNKTKCTQNASVLPKKQAKDLTLKMKPLSRRKSTYPELNKGQKQEGLSDPS
jgi:hypothetical protein